jgi:hypothetical protein
MARAFFISNHKLHLWNKKGIINLPYLERLMAIALVTKKNSKLRDHKCFLAA